jgi:hypothetical protein
MAGQDTFELSQVAVSGNTIFVRRYGKGPGILLIHGFPRTSVELVRRARRSDLLAMDIALAERAAAGELSARCSRGRLP